jgi:hypothetical protein
MGYSGTEWGTLSRGRKAPLPDKAQPTTAVGSTADCLLPTAYCLLPTPYCLLPTAYCLLSTAYCLLPTACLLPAYCLLLLATGYWLLATDCLLPTATAYYLTYCPLPPTSYLLTTSTRYSLTGEGRLLE